MSAGTDTPSVTDRLRPFDAGAPVVAAHFLGGRCVFVLAEEAALFLDPEGAQERVSLHAGGILASACDGKQLITGGDDGSVVLTDGAGRTEPVMRDPRRRWIDHVALGPGGARAWSVGKTVFFSSGNEEPRTLDLPSTPGGLAFMPKGVRLAASHYDGVTLWFPNAAATPESLFWKGSHAHITVSPDGKYVLTAMQEPMLHGWRVADRKDMRMSGYSGKVTSMSWSAGGRHLATSGSEQLILWPFTGKDGPMGKSPTMHAPYGKRVVAVACHPKEDIVATGFEDGLVLLVRIGDGAEIIARRPGGSPITALAWSTNGEQLALGTEGGEAALLDLR